VTSDHCRICGSDTRGVGRVHGDYSQRDYTLARCDSCGFAFVADPWLDYEQIYDDAYYAGEGADPLVDYRFELEHPDRTIRRYEWQGIARVVRDLTGDLAARRWLDYGAGNGGLVRYLREACGVDACGYESGASAARARAAGIPIVDRPALAALGEAFDVVSAIEVLEHTYDPLAELRAMRALLRPGGLLFLTTGNARPYADRIERWRYVTPEIHISLFEPRTLDAALAAASFTPEHRSLGPGFDEILTFKVLKNLRVRQRSRFTDHLPRRLIAQLADRVTRLSEHPIGWAA
jgi:SAM-dependent methyltransferase